MKQTTKIIFLILAFVLPIGIFIFLKVFGRNEFDVAPLFATTPPPQAEGCDRNVSLPYVVPDSIRSRFRLTADSLTVFFFGPVDNEALNQIDRVSEQTVSDPVQLIKLISTGAATPGHEAGVALDSVSRAETTAGKDVDYMALRRCIFLLNGDSNVVMLDKRGVIRGQYIASDRDDIDRLLTEITILLRKY